jgi:Molecular chaperone (small heat shock protein)
MSTLEQIRHGLSRAWDSMAEGWQQLRERAAQAMTRYTPARHGGAVETAEDQIAARSARWGLLAAEVQENEDEVVVRLEAPGMEKDQFDINVIDGRYLSVRGEKRVQREEKRGRYHVMECAYGSFERAVALPAEVDDSRARASYRSGVLRVTLPKVRGGGVRRIQVQG